MEKKMAGGLKRKGNLSCVGEEVGWRDRGRRRLEKKMAADPKRKRTRSTAEKRMIMYRCTDIEGYLKGKRKRRWLQA